MDATTTMTDPTTFEDENTNPITTDDDESAEAEAAELTIRYRGATTDPLFGLLVAGAVAVGSMPLAANDADLRYTLAWGLLAVFGVLAWLMGNFPRVGEERPEDLAWGVALSLVLGIPLLAFGSGLLVDLTARIWEGFTPGMVLAYLVFVMPLGETLFFRGIMQELRAFWEVGIIATIWGLVLFFPHINVGPLPLIAIVVLGMVNVLYSYVRMRNGLAAAWLCQISVNLMIFFFSSI